MGNTSISDWGPLVGLYKGSDFLWQRKFRVGVPSGIWWQWCPATPARPASFPERLRGSYKAFSQLSGVVREYKLYPQSHAPWCQLCWEAGSVCWFRNMQIMTCWTRRSQWDTHTEAAGSSLGIWVPFWGHEPTGLFWLKVCIFNTLQHPQGLLLTDLRSEGALWAGGRAVLQTRSPVNSRLSSKHIWLYKVTGMEVTNFLWA